MNHLRVAVLLLIAMAPSCRKNDIPTDLDFRQEMRIFVERISAYARSLKPGFIVIPQNGQELISLTGEAAGPLAEAYVQAISGQGREDLFYGYTGDGIPTPAPDRIYMEEFLDKLNQAGGVILVTDYVSAQLDVLSSYLQNESKGYISFAAGNRALDRIPSFPDPPYQANTSDVLSLDQAKNFLYLINPELFPTRWHFVDSLARTSFDLLIVDLFFQEGDPLTFEDLQTLKIKANGGRRLVICYLSIGEAENYRYYWQPGWEIGRPDWLEDPNPDWPGNYKVRYWDPAWQSIICGPDGSYVERIIHAGFDGVYLDLVDAFEYFEE